MSRQIDITKPLSPEDRKYLEDRTEWRMLAENAALLKGQEFTASEPVVEHTAQDSLEHATPTPPEELIIDPEVEQQVARSKK